MVLSLKPLRRLALGKGVEGEASLRHAINFRARQYDNEPMSSSARRQARAKGEEGGVKTINIKERKLGNVRVGIGQPRVYTHVPRIS